MDEDYINKLKRDIEEYNDLIMAASGNTDALNVLWNRMSEEDQNHYGDKWKYLSKLEDKLEFNQSIVLEYNSTLQLMSKREREGDELENEGSQKMAKYMKAIPSIDVKEKEVKLGDTSIVTAQYLDTDLQVLGVDSSPEILYVRECYSKIFDFMMNRKNVKKFVISGTPGIGKTFGGAYFVYRLCKMEPVPKYVIYRYGPLKNSTTFLFVNGKYSRPVRNVKEFNRIVKDESDSWLVFDPPKVIEQTDADLWNCNVIVVSSPDRERYRKILKGQNALALYLPIWTKKELEIASKLVFESDIWKDRYDIWGGVPRKLFDTNEIYSLEDFKDNMNAFQAIKIGQVLLTTMEINSKTFTGDHKALHSYLHLDLKRDSKGEMLFSKPKTKWASGAAYSLAVEKYSSENQSFIRSLLEQQIGLGLAGTGPGQHFENCAHIMLRDALAIGPMKIKSLDTNKEVDYQFNCEDYKTFWNLEDLEIKKNCLYVPIKRNLKSIDSFMVVDSSTFPLKKATRSSKGLMILGFQVTVNKKGHPVLARGLEEVYTHCKKALKKDVEFHLIFCVSEELYDTKVYSSPQKIDSTKSKYKPTAQYCLEVDYSNISPQRSANK